MQGYLDKMECLIDEIRLLRKGEKWDSGDTDFDDAQEIVQVLRQSCVSDPRRGREEGSKRSW